MQSQARSLKFSGTWTQVACVILAHAATRMMFRVFFGLPLPNNTVQTFSGAKGSSLSRLVQAMFKWIF